MKRERIIDRDVFADVNNGIDSRLSSKLGGDASLQCGWNFECSSASASTKLGNPAERLNYPPHSESALSVSRLDNVMKLSANIYAETQIHCLPRRNFDFFDR